MSHGCWVKRLGVEARAFQIRVELEESSYFSLEGSSRLAT